VNDRADERLREICRDTSRVTVVALCYGICRDLAHEELSRAHRTVPDVAGILGSQRSGTVGST
jgi:hypothetical protein